MEVKEFHLPEPDDATDAALLIALAAKQCYMSFEPGLNPNVTKVRKDLVEYLDNILASGHGSVLEHATFSFAINGVSRVFTGEMNRHRAGWALSERSMRFIRFQEFIPWWMPTCLEDDYEKDDTVVLGKKAESRELFHRMFAAESEAYQQFMQIWNMDEDDKNFKYKKLVTSCARRIIGMGCATGGIWTGNVRALRHVITMRAAAAAEEEIFHVFSRIAEMIVKSEPMLFGDFWKAQNGSWNPKYSKV